MNNIVFYFSGTGNSLKVAKDISRDIGNCEIVSMSRNFNITKKYDTIGFVYPNYYWGLPKKVIEFIENIDLTNNKGSYYYSIATYGGDLGNSVYQIYELLLKKHGVKINYGQKLKMFPNYVISYNMSRKKEQIIKKANEKLIPIINSIKSRTHNRISKFTKIFAFVNKSFIKKVSDMDRDYSVNDNCKGCNICEKVCPVNNIEIINSRPQYKHHCENCVACIQYCPQKAINYKNATQKRRRYTNPEISYMELCEYNNKQS